MTHFLLSILVSLSAPQAPFPPAPTPARAVLKRTLAAGEESSYDFCCAFLTHNDVPGAVPSSAVSTWTGTYKVTSVEDGRAKLAIGVKGFTIDGTRPTRVKGSSPDGTVEMLMDDKGWLTPAKKGGPEDSNGGWFVWESLDLPGRELASGDTWDVTFPHEAVLHSGEKVPAKFEGATSYKGHAAYAISITVKNAPFTKKVVSRKKKDDPGKPGTTSGTGSMHIDLLVDQQTGRYLFAEERLHTVQTYKIDGEAETKPLVTDFTATMRIRE